MCILVFFFVFFKLKTKDFRPNIIKFHTFQPKNEKTIIIITFELNLKGKLTKRINLMPITLKWTEGGLKLIKWTELDRSRPNWTE